MFKTAQWDAALTRYLAARDEIKRDLQRARELARIPVRLPDGGQISWETEVWIAEDPGHVVHFNGERFLGPYPDTVLF